MPITLAELGHRTGQAPYDEAELRKAFYDIHDETFWRITAEVYESTQLNCAPLWALYSSTRYVVEQGIDGDIVECGVYFGGSVMMILRTLQSMGVQDRRIVLYDSFEMFTGVLTEHDINYWGNPVVGLANNFMDVARSNILETGYPEANVVFVPGNVEDTLATAAHERIALLRLDTDTYFSTKVELEVLYPSLVPGGVIIVDDYGYNEGCRKATDEYFDVVGSRPLFHRTTNNSRTGLKPPGG